jgi:hypothetical protein
VCGMRIGTEERRKATRATLGGLLTALRRPAAWPYHHALGFLPWPKRARERALPVAGGGNGNVFLCQPPGCPGTLYMYWSLKVRPKPRQLDVNLEGNPWSLERDALRPPPCAVVAPLLIAESTCEGFTLARYRP